MAWITHLFRCDDCGFEVTEMVDPQNIVAPDCPECEQNPGMSGPIPSTTAIGARNASKSVDGMYRSMEEGAAIRAEALGDPSMKMTDMKDNYYGGGTREGDVTAPTVNNAVTQYAAQTNFNGGKFWGHGGGAVAGGQTLEAIQTRALTGAKQAQSNGISTITDVIQGGSGPLQFPTRQRPQT